MSTERTDDELTELLPLYALGSLDREETAAVEQYVAQHPDAAAQLRELEDGLAYLAYAAPSAPLPSDAKARLLKRAQSELPVRGQPVAAQPASERVETPARRPRRQGVWGLAQMRWAVLAAVLAGLLGWNLQLQRALNAPAVQIAALAGQPDTQTSLLVNTSAAPFATGRLYLTADGQRGVLAVSGLPVLPAGRAYQFWFARPDKSRDSAAVFVVDGRGEALVSITAPGTLAQYDQIWITQEPAGGSAKPTAPHFLEGPLVAHSAAAPARPQPRSSVPDA